MGVACREHTGTYVGGGKNRQKNRQTTDNTKDKQCREEADDI